MLPDSDRPLVSSSSPVMWVSHGLSAGGLGKLTLLVVLAELKQVVDVFLAKGLQHHNRVTLQYVSTDPTARDALVILTSSTNG